MSHDRRSFGRTKRWLAFGVVALSACTWSFGFYRSMQVRDEWRARVAADGARFLSNVEPGDVPGYSGALLEMGQFLGDQALPPDYEGAESLIERALLRDPLDSELWMYGARYRLFALRWDEARAALEFGERVHPYHTAQRVLAIELWDLLGDRDRALEVAEQIGAASPKSRRDVARQLRGMGVGAEEAFAMLGTGEELTAAEYADLVEVLFPDRVDTMSSVMALIPERVYGDEEFRRRAALRVSRPKMVLDAAWRLWEFEDGRLGDVGGTVPAVRATNLDLSDSPLYGNFVYGWQKYPVSLDSEATWESSAGGGGRLRMRFARDAREEVFRWKFYVLPVPAREEPLGFRLNLEAETAEGRSLYQFSAVAEGQRGDTAWLEAGAGEFVVMLPPSGEAQLVELSLLRRKPASRLEDAEVVVLRGLEIRTISGEATP